MLGWLNVNETITSSIHVYSTPNNSFIRPYNYFVGMHGILEAVIDRLSKKNVVVNDEILKLFKAFGASKDKLLSRNIR